LVQTQGLVIDGGTTAGVMGLMGAARRANNDGFPLLGVAAEGTVDWPGRSQATTPHADSGRAMLEPHHSHQLLVPGDAWGDEAGWLAAAASALIPRQRSLTLVCGGGMITKVDIAKSLRRRRPVVVLQGTGGSADALAERLQRRPARSGLLRVLPLAQAAETLADWVLHRSPNAPLLP
jgi:hypothetical protein